MKHLALSLLLTTAPAGAPTHIPTVFYGVVPHGGAYGFGSVIQDDGVKAPERIYSFCQLGEGKCFDGEYPNSLVQLPDGSLIGTTAKGGTHGAGTLFQFQRTDTGWIGRSGSLCWYWQDCTRFGFPRGTLTYMDLSGGFPRLKGIIENGKGRGLIYTAIFSPDGIWVHRVRLLKHGE